MTKAHKNLEIGLEIPPRSYEITQEKINIYSRYVFQGRDTKNIHTDDEAARKAGLARAVAQGRYPIGYLSEVMRDFFGKGWVQGGKLEVSLIKPIFPGDRITIRGKIRNKIQEGKATRVILEVWLENQKGEKATVGMASGLVEA
ncbi:MAG: MaoC family dehydratase [Deltaproteobacteria bacterium]|nr:MaoC family dehydratase [Deltaproteobacteria bacterium]